MTTPRERGDGQHRRGVRKREKRLDVSLPAAAIQYPLRHPAVVSVVTGMRTAEHVRSTANRYRQDIPDALWDELHSTGSAPDPARNL